MGSFASRPHYHHQYHTDLIYLNVYRLAIAPGSYHTSVVVLGYEISFAAEAGIWLVSCSLPSDNDKVPNAALSWSQNLIESLFVGRLPVEYKDTRMVPGRSITIGEARLMTLLEMLSTKYHGGSYHLIRLNCNDFCEELIQHLVAPHLFHMPKYITRVTRLWPGFCHDVCLCVPRRERASRRRKGRRHGLCGPYNSTYLTPLAAEKMLMLGRFMSVNSPMHDGWIRHVDPEDADFVVQDMLSLDGGPYASLPKTTPAAQ